MTRQQRNLRSTLPVSRNIVSHSGRNANVRVLPVAPVEMHQNVKRGRRTRTANKGARTLWNASPYYMTAATIDIRWSL